MPVSTVGPRTPVLVGAADVSERIDDPLQAPEPLELMVRAAAAAAGDAAGAAAGDASGGAYTSLLAAADLVLVPRGSWSYGDPGRLVARRFGNPGARSVVAEIGVLQTTLLARAVSAIASGAADVVLVCGAEGRYREQRARAEGVSAPATGDLGVPDEKLAPTGRIISAAEGAAGLVNAPSHYALLENARRAAHHLSLEAHARQISELWSRFSSVAAGNPRAWFPRPMTAEEIGSETGGNRLIAYPYRKWQVSQWNVDQAAALILCSAEAARAHGVAADRWVFIHSVVESNLMVPVSERPLPARSPGFEIAGRAALDAAGAGIDDIAHLELYSCFPVAVSVQAEELGIAPDRPVTLTGGMTFAGGPLNHYTLQSGAQMIRALREAPGTLGLLTAVSGMLTKQGVTVWGGPPAGRCRVEDVSANVAARVEPVPMADGAAGRATVVTYTVLHGRTGPERAVAVVELPDGRRSLAVSTRPAVMAAMESEEWIGRGVSLDGGGGFDG